MPGCFLYRHFGADGRLLYVGTAANPVLRSNGHSFSAPWFASIRNITVEEFPTLGEARDAEAKAIAHENPLHNVQRPTPPHLRGLTKSPVGRPPIFTERAAIRAYVEAWVAAALAKAAGDQSLSSFVAEILTDWVKRRTKG
jgi:hypothetical protein